MQHYAKTDGYKWTNGDGNYYIELYCPDNAPTYTLVADSNIPEPELDDADYAAAAKILMGVIE